MRVKRAPESSHTDRVVVLPTDGVASLLDRFGDLIACACGGDFKANPAGRQLTCRACGQGLHGRDGILTMEMPTEDLTPEQLHQRREEAIRDQQASFYDLMVNLNVSNWMESRKIHRGLNKHRPQAALEVGCGTGRLTVPLAARSERVVAIDRSLKSLELCRKRLIERNLLDRVLLIQADISQMPFRPGAYDLALTAQVIQHLPTALMRDDAVRRIALSLREGAGLIFSGYEWRGRLYFWMHKEGFHQAGIPFTRFNFDDIHRLLGQNFQVHKIESCAGKIVVVFAQTKLSAYCD